MLPGLLAGASAFSLSWKDVTVFYPAVVSCCVVPRCCTQSAAVLQSENPASVEAFEMMAPAVETEPVDHLLTDKDMAKADVSAAPDSTILSYLQSGPSTCTAL